jgi:molybdopterin-guanine dinucleotide biosynthesis protein A
MPFVTPDVCALVAAALGPGRAAAVAYGGERLHPLLAAYAPEGLEVLRSAPEGEPLTRTVEALEPVRVDVDADVVFNVNTPDDLAEAERRLRSGSSEARP